MVKVPGDALKYDRLVDIFEDIEEAIGGQLRDEEHLGRITYTSPDGTRIRFDLESGRVSLSGGDASRHPLYLPAPTNIGSAWLAPPSSCWPDRQIFFGFFGCCVLVG